jgi:outer membrane protein assembly factor BamB
VSHFLNVALATAKAGFIMRFFKGVPLLIGIAAVLSGVSGVQADDWNQWRGANRSGKVSNFPIPKTWPSSLTKKWSIEVGQGHSSPIIVGDKAYALVRKGDNEITYCLSMKDGKTIWQDTVSAPFDSVIFPAQKLGKAPRSTPLIAGGKLYITGVGGMMTCFDAATGKVLWRKDFASMFTVPMPICGAALSPLVDGKKIYIHAGQGDEGAFFALDKDTGKILWKWSGEGPAYSSPQIASIAGFRQIVTAAHNSWISLDPVDGKLLWRIPNRQNMFNHNSITPIIVGDTIITGANMRETIAYKISRAGGKWETAQLWATRNVTMSTSSPILDGNRIYAVNEKRRGQIVAMTLDSGQVFWACEGNKGENVTLYDVGADVLAFDAGGEMIVYNKTAKGLLQAAKYDVADSQVWASPAVSNNRILVKGAETLTLWEVPAR